MTIITQINSFIEIVTKSPIVVGCVVKKFKENHDMMTIIIIIILIFIMEEIFSFSYKFIAVHIFHFWTKFSSQALFLTRHFSSEFNESHEELL